MVYVVAIVVVAVAAFFGVLTGMAATFHRRNPPPKWLAAIHGVLAAVGIIILAVAVIRNGDQGMGLNALLVVLLTALGGLALLSFHGRGRRLPVSLLVLHGLFAIGGFGLMIVAAAVTLYG